MPRPPRMLRAEETYHVMSRGSKKAAIFHDRADYRVFLNLLLKFSLEFGVTVFHYVLMTNHIHLLLRPGTNGSGFMQKLKSRYAVYFVNKYGIVGHVWQSRFKDEHIDTDAYLQACGNYIEMNPVRAMLVKTPADWPYSSFHYYATGKKDPIITSDPLYKGMSRTLRGRQRIYRAQASQTRSF